MNIQQTTSNKGECGWLHQPLSLLCPDLTAWFKIKIKEICQQAFPQLRRIPSCCGFCSAPIWECQTDHEWGGSWADCHSTFYQFQINKTSPLWQRLILYQFYFMVGTGADMCHQTLGVERKISSFISSCIQTFQACSKQAEQAPVNLVVPRSEIQSAFQWLCKDALQWWELHGEPGTD